MGKVDDLRALREARYAERHAPVKTVGKAKKVLEEATRAGSAAVQPAQVGELCGHRSIGNKSCTREADHVATGTKSHRYT